jgi:hypothetical protein
MFTAVTKPDPVRFPTQVKAFCGRRQVEVVDLASAHGLTAFALMAIVQDAIDTDTIVDKPAEIVDLDLFLKARPELLRIVWSFLTRMDEVPGLEECTDNKSGNWTIKDVLQILCAVFDRTLQPVTPSDKYIEVATYLNVLPMIEKTRAFVGDTRVVDGVKSTLCIEPGTIDVYWVSVRK